MHRVGFIYSDDLMSYDFGGDHPLKPLRLRMTYDLLQAYGALSQPGAALVAPSPASREDILLAHDEEYVSAVERISRGEVVYDAYLFGFFSPDTPSFPGMYEASLLYTGATIRASEMVMSGEADVAFSIAGGLHHAHRRRASGFCVFNDPAIALHRMLRKYDRIAYVDIDAHHADGVQAEFYDSNSVLTCSVHESGRWIFPRTGFVNEIGTGVGTGFSLNAPLAPYTDDDTFCRVVEEGVLPVVKAFQPEALFLQIGVDGHFEDPLTQLSYTTDGWTRVVRMLLDLGLPTVAVGGGGYNLFTVCRMWTLGFGEMMEIDLPQDTPEKFRQAYHIYVLRDIFHPEIPMFQRRTVADTAEETLEMIRKMVFPYHGLSGVRSPGSG